MRFAHRRDSFLENRQEDDELSFERFVAAIWHLAAVTKEVKPYTSTRFATNVPFG
jgi:hypothetical protein